MRIAPLRILTLTAQESLFGQCEEAQPGLQQSVASIITCVRRRDQAAPFP